MESAREPRYDWYETDKHVVINIFVKNMKPDLVSVRFEPKSVHFTYKNESDENYELNIDLNGKISVADSSYRVLSVKAEVKMSKIVNYRWGKLKVSKVKFTIYCFIESMFYFFFVL